MVQLLKNYTSNKGVQVFLPYLRHVATLPSVICNTLSFSDVWHEIVMKAWCTEESRKKRLKQLSQYLGSLRPVNSLTYICSTGSLLQIAITKFQY